MFFNIDRYYYCFATNENEAYFWHGQTTDSNGIHGGMNNARNIAMQNGGKTLEMCMLDNIDELESAGVNIELYSDGSIKEIFYGETEEENEQFWKDCSDAFAKQAQGDVHVIEGTDCRPNGVPESECPCIYNTLEHDMLANYNSDITSITSVDAVTGLETGMKEIVDQGIEYGGMMF